MQYFSTSEKPILGEIRAGLFKTAPTGWLMLDGSTFDKTEYPRLFELLGTNTLPDMRAATICGKGDAVPADWAESPGLDVIRNKTNYDSGAIGEVVGENAQLVPRHSHNLFYQDSTGAGNSLLVKVSGGTESGMCMSLTSGSGYQAFTAIPNELEESPQLPANPNGIYGGKTLYTDVRGKRLLCNFIIRAV